MSSWKYPDESCRFGGTELEQVLVSSVKLPENVIPTITDRDFVVATVALQL